MEIRKGHPVQWISTQWSTEMSGPPFGAVRRLVAAFLPAPNLKAPVGKTLRSQGRAKSYPTPDLLLVRADLFGRRCRSGANPFD